MIVLDEQISRECIREALGWYPGKVVFLKALRIGTVIKDDAVPALLRSAHECTFATINVTDFWRVAAADRRYCLVCLDLPKERLPEIPGLIRRLLNLPEFRAKASRMGKVVLIGHGPIRYYTVGDPRIHELPWSDRS